MSTLVVSSYYKLKYDRWNEDIVSHFPHRRPYVKVEDNCRMVPSDEDWNPITVDKPYGVFSVENIQKLVDLGHDVLLYTNKETLETIDLPEGVMVELQEFDEMYHGLRLERNAFAEWKYHLSRLFDGSDTRYPSDAHTIVTINRFMKVPWYYPVVVNKLVQLGNAAEKYGESYENFAWLDTHMWTSSQPLVSNPEFTESYDWDSMVDRMVKFANDKVFLWEILDFGLMSAAFIAGKADPIKSFVSQYKKQIDLLVDSENIIAEEKIMWLIANTNKNLFNVIGTAGYYTIPDMLHNLVKKTT